jgi:hypothetical protein
MHSVRSPAIVKSCFVSPCKYRRSSGASPRSSDVASSSSRDAASRLEVTSLRKRGRSWGSFSPDASAVTYLEGLVLYDLPRLDGYLPPAVTLERLAGRTTGQIGRLITGQAQRAIHPAVAVWSAVAGRLLSRAAEIRNPVLHARPATVDNQQQLFRWLPDVQFPVTAERLLHGVVEIEDMVRELSGQRLPLKAFPPVRAML